MKKQKINDFQKAVYNLVRMVPYGRVSTYGRVAAVLGYPRAAQAVGWALHWADIRKVPCQRIVNRFGGLASGYTWGGREGHKIHLLAEKITVNEDCCVNLDKYLWEFPEDLVMKFRKKTKIKLEDLPYL